MPGLNSAGRGCCRAAGRLKGRALTRTGLVLGGFSVRKRADVGIDLLGSVTRGELEPPDPTIGMLAGMITANGVDTVTALWLVEGLQAEPFDPAVDVPAVPTLIVCGADDGALTSREFRTAAIAFVVG